MQFTFGDKWEANVTYKWEIWINWMGEHEVSNAAERSRNNFPEMLLPSVISLIVFTDNHTWTWYDIYTKMFKPGLVHLPREPNPPLILCLWYIVHESNFFQKFVRRWHLWAKSRTIWQVWWQYWFTYFSCWKRADLLAGYFPKQVRPLTS